MFLQSLTTSLAVFVKDLSSLLVNSFSEILRICLALSVDGFKGFLFKLKAQYSDFIRFLQIEVLSVLKAGRMYCKWRSLIERSSFLWMPWIIEKWMNARIFIAAFKFIKTFAQCGLSNVCFTLCMPYMSTCLIPSPLK